MKFLLLVVILVPFAASEENGTAIVLPEPILKSLQDKMVSFTKTAGQSYLKMPAVAEELGSFTTCGRYFHDSSKNFDLVSLEGRDGIPELTLSMRSDSGFQVTKGEVTVPFPMPPVNLNVWHDFCFTWEAATGVVQMWHANSCSPRKYLSNAKIPGVSALILGQKAASTVGHIQLRDVNAWRRPLASCEIKSFMKKGIMPAKDMADWARVDYEVVGDAIVEDDQQACL